MKTLMLALIVALTPAAFAKQEAKTKVSADQIAKSKGLPQTVVIRRSKANPQDIAVVHLKDKLPAGQKLSGAAFEKMALNAETKGIAFDSANELDARTSTSSWSFGLYYSNNGYYNRPYYGGYNRPYYGGYYNNSYYRPYYPTYSYNNYSYRYVSYYSYSTTNYDYDYCSWYY